MTRDESDVVQLLIDAGVLTLEDAKDIETLKGEAVLERMIAMRVLLPSEIEMARRHIVDALTRTNRTKRLHAQASLVQIITNNLHRRLDNAGEQVRVAKKHITGGAFAAIAAAKPDK
jgi:hypothetical protein